MRMCGEREGLGCAALGHLRAMLWQSFRAYYRRSWGHEGNEEAESGRPRARAHRRTNLTESLVEETFVKMRAEAVPPRLSPLMESAAAALLLIGILARQVVHAPLVPVAQRLVCTLPWPWPSVSFDQADRSEAAKGTDLDFQELVFRILRRILRCRWGGEGNAPGGCQRQVTAFQTAVATAGRWLLPWGGLRSGRAAAMGRDLLPGSAHGPLALTYSFASDAPDWILLHSLRKEGGCWYLAKGMREAQLGGGSPWGMGGSTGMGC